MLDSGFNLFIFFFSLVDYPKGFVWCFLPGITNLKLCFLGTSFEKMFQTKDMLQRGMCLNLLDS